MFGFFLVLISKTNVRVSASKRQRTFKLLSLTDSISMHILVLSADDKKSGTTLERDHHWKNTTLTVPPQCYHCDSTYTTNIKRILNIRIIFLIIILRSIS